MPLDFANPGEIARSWKFLDTAPPPASAYEAHEAIENGLPAAALRNFKAAVTELSDKAWAEIIMVSVTQLKRLRTGDKKLPIDVGSQLVLFAVMLSRAEDILGGRAAALLWLGQEQVALSGRRPIDLLDTYIGANLVERTLTQIDYGVYV
jgi:putative toxin-antitoxin system antitoxin component (TIGR02293 family)